MKEIEWAESKVQGDIVCNGNEDDFKNIIVK